MAEDATPTLVPGRECGPCTACCVHLLIESSEFTKLQGVVCPNCELEKGCKIYATRPQPCRDFICGWRIMPQFDEHWRPDKSGVIVKIAENPSGPPEFHFVLFGSKYVLLQPKFAAMIGQFVSEGRQTYLVLPGKPDEMSTKVPLNAGLQRAVARRDLNAISSGLALAYESGITALREKLNLEGPGANSFH
jgi:hypothetical protein